MAQQNIVGVEVLKPYVTLAADIDDRGLLDSRRKVAAITEKLNEIRAAFLKSDADLLWIVDADNEVPSYALHKLMSLDVDIASGCYPMHSDCNSVCGGYMTPQPHIKMGSTTPAWIRDKILGLDGRKVAGGNGCLLVKRRVFEPVAEGAVPLVFRYFPGNRSSDIQFFLDAQEAGFQAAVHGGVMCGHLPEWSLDDISKKTAEVSISVVVPFYNKAGPWKETWRRLEPQLLIGDEVLIVDDHSTVKEPDGSEHGFEFAGKWTQTLRPEKLEPHIYRCNSLRNMGLQEARNDAVLLLDPDCIPEPDLLDNARRLFDPGIVYGGRIDYETEIGGVTWDPRLYWKHDLKAEPLVDSLVNAAIYLWGGCMLFSRRKASMVGWFSKEYDGGWGLGEQDFVEKLMHIGVRLRYEERLKVVHQHHEKNTVGHSRNQALFWAKSEQYAKALDKATPYRSRVKVLVVSMMRSYYLDECLKRIFSGLLPVKVVLVNQGDRSPEMLRAVANWRRRWCVEYRWNDKPESMAVIRAAEFKRAAEEGYKYVATVDDDMMLDSGAMDELIMAAERHPQYHAVAGYVVEPTRRRMLGGRTVIEGRNLLHCGWDYMKGVNEVDYVSSGFRIVRLDPLVLQDTDYEFGWIDWDYSERLKAAGLRLAVTGGAGGHHGMMLDADGRWKPVLDSPEYEAIRLDRARIERMTELFREKWGKIPKVGRR